MKVCLLTSQRLDADPFPDDDWPCDPRPFLPEAEWEVATLRKPTAVKKVTRLARRDFDLFFNLCDGAWDEATPGIEVVHALERLNVPFTGGTSDFYEPSREVMKRVCREWGIDAPAHVFATSEDDVERAADTLRFPLFVKHPSSYASVGLTRDSKVETPEALRRQARLMMRPYGGALIEEYVAGTECTVLVAENPADPDAPLTYQPVQYRFPEGEEFKHEAVKWVDYRGMQAFPVEDPELGARLREASARFFLGLAGAGYGRCDLRVDADGRPFMLEINANCGLYYPPADAGSADFCLSLDPAGHAGFTRDVVASALARHARRQAGWEVRHRPGGRLAVHATRAFRRGERIVPFERQERRLLTSRELLREARGARRAWLKRHAWPVDDELWACWSRDPKKWAPVGHSCEPSAWLRGLDVVARRAIAPGEEVTLEYATLHDERMPSFACDCGAPSCRGRIRGTEHRLPLVECYGEHVTSHVRRKREG
jgi:D-alanine-D-alanine ligase